MLRYTFLILFGLCVIMAAPTCHPAVSVAHSQTPAKNNPNIGDPSPATPKQERGYRRGRYSGQAIVDGIWFSITTFESSDGMEFTKYSVGGESSKEANKVLSVRLKRALEIIKREPLLNEKKRKIGQKVIATFPPEPPQAGYASLLWTAEGEFFEVRSASVQNILEYQKDFKR